MGVAARTSWRGVPFRQAECLELRPGSDSDRESSDQKPTTSREAASVAAAKRDRQPPKLWCRRLTRAGVVDEGTTHGKQEDARRPYTSRTEFYLATGDIYATQQLLGHAT